ARRAPATAVEAAGTSFVLSEAGVAACVVGVVADAAAAAAAAASSASVGVYALSTFMYVLSVSLAARPPSTQQIGLSTSTRRTMMEAKYDANSTYRIAKIV